jgi:delta-aminolevulinic acid dehydratase/porphobilinogen synthase
MNLLRSLVRETTLSPSDFMFPMFIAGEKICKVEIASVSLSRRSIDLTVEEIKKLYAFVSCGKHLCKSKCQRQYRKSFIKESY